MAGIPTPHEDDYRCYLSVLAGFTAPQSSEPTIIILHFTYNVTIQNGGDGGIRTLDRFPCTRVPGGLLKPLGHVTILSNAQQLNI